MELDGSLMGFDGTSKSGVSTRATDSWNDGDVIYLVLYSGKDKIEGKGVYSSDNGKWTLFYYGQLEATDSSYCVVHFFDGNATLNRAETEVTISPTTAVYGSTEASYSKNGRVVKVKATLAPLTGRIAFRGDDGYRFTLKGFDYYNGYSIVDGTLTSMNFNETITISETEDTIFYYGFFPSTHSQHRLIVSTDSIKFVQICDDDVLSIAHSGIILAPTSIMHNNWRRNKPLKTVTVNGVSFDLILVGPGTFQMGADGKWNYGEHQVTLTNDYYMGKTEVTQALWEAVMGSNPSSYKGANNPVENVSWDDCQIFIANLNTLTGLSFRLPSEAEWEYAARGGNKSKGYSYSGSNNNGDVAWYDMNSNGHHHVVATKAPNELGIYDMSGNVYEWCSDRWIGTFSSYSVINPSGPNSGYDRARRGGSWNELDSYCWVAYRYGSAPNIRTEHVGMRLCSSAE